MHVIAVGYTNRLWHGIRSLNLFRCFSVLLLPVVECVLNSPDKLRVLQILIKN